MLHLLNPCTEQLALALVPPVDPLTVGTTLVDALNDELVFEMLRCNRIGHLAHR